MEYTGAFQPPKGWSIQDGYQIERTGLVPWLAGIPVKDALLSSAEEFVPVGAAVKGEPQYYIILIISVGEEKERPDVPGTLAEHV